MPRMKKPAPPRDDPWRSTLPIAAFAHRRGLSPRQVRRLLASGRLPFIEVRGQIRVPRAAAIEESVRLT